MLSGVYRNTLLDRVVYGRPAADVLDELLGAYGKRRALVVSTRSLSGPQRSGATGIAEGLGERCVGLFGAHLGPLAARRRDRRGRRSAARCRPTSWWPWAAAR